jgi:membrane protease YdiL (CAAX protease family)
MMEQPIEQNMNPKVDTRRILIFLAFAFGIAWVTGLVIYLTGGLQNSPQVLPGVTLAVILMATAYMWAPALGNILTRLVTREGWKEVGLRPHFKQGWRYWLIGWVLPGFLTLFGAALFFLLFPQYFDASLSPMTKMMGSAAVPAALTPWTLAIIQFFQAILLSPILNSIATFGEEFGWRAYLQPKLMPLGGRKAMLWIGLIWGIWHWPIIFMGYEYGFDYPGYPWAGPLLFILITFAFGTFLGWLVLRAKSVWPAVIGHASINGIALIAILATVGDPNRLLGPLPVGLIGFAGYALLTVLLFVSSRALKA